MDLQKCGDRYYETAQQCADYLYRVNNPVASEFFEGIELGAQVVGFLIPLAAFLLVAVLVLGVVLHVLGRVFPGRHEQEDGSGEKQNE